ncbi:hypothetical protein [Alkalihalobacillus sp. AL-G]|uniref:hypothetical protein n=1 Tax=Alkalihalobacillus sp. AL-G TaxID=2926399 RepID=UPI00272D47AD|nr:hypothetical protein [Alkalihalobacillus sp. AL-G]WLD93047.1 hypothetical protein MOJ78_18935 [Alkalihalobacillus sp. AL-G]
MDIGGWGMICLILGVLFILYVIFSLSTIKHKLNLIMEHFNIVEEEETKVSNEEIENELENEK